MPNFFLLLYNFILHDGSSGLQDFDLILKLRYFPILLLFDVLNFFLKPFVSLIQDVRNTDCALLVTAVFTSTVWPLN